MKRLNTNIRQLINTDVIMFFLFVISFIHSSLVGLLYAFLLIASFSKNQKYGVKSLIYITIRGILNSSVIATAAPWQMAKWVLLMVISGWVIIHSNCYSMADKNKKKIVITIIILFVINALFGSFLVSSYPTISIFRIIGFSMPMIAIIAGVCSTYQNYDWGHFMAKLLFFMFSISFVILPFSQFRIVNSNFQGVFNHVNILGVMSAIFVAVLLFDKENWNKHIFRITLFTTIFMEYESKSRTGMYSIIIVFLLYYLPGNISLWRRIQLIVSTVISIILVQVIMPDGLNVINTIDSFVHKSSNDVGFMGTRTLIMMDYLNHFRESPLIGTGFMTPYYRGIRDFSFSFDLTMEPGTIIAELLGDTGIIGFIIFILLYIVLLFKGNKRYLFILIVTFAINMGEVVFFSTNNMSIICYMCIALYLFNKKEEQNNNANIVE